MRAGGPVAVVAGAVFGVVGLVGCNQPGPSGSAEDVIGRAPDLTVSAGTARISIDQGGTHAEGVVDLGADRLRVTVTTTAAGGSGPTTEVIAVGSDVWSRVGGAAVWSRTSLPDLGLLSLPGVASGDPRSLVALVRGTSDIEPYGGVQVRRVSAIRYDLKADPQQAARAANGVAPALDALAGAIDHTVSLSCYVDGDGRIRRIDAPENLRRTTLATRPDGAPVVTTVDFLSFGVSDQIVPPSPDQVG